MLFILVSVVIFVEREMRAVIISFGRIVTRDERHCCKIVRLFCVLCIVAAGECGGRRARECSTTSASCRRARMCGKLKAKYLKALMAYLKEKKLDERDFGGRVGM